MASFAASREACKTSSKSGHWTCSVCTFAGNPQLFLACSLCNTARNVVMETSTTERATKRSPPPSPILSSSLSSTNISRNESKKQRSVKDSTPIDTGHKASLNAPSQKVPLQHPSHVGAVKSEIKHELNDNNAVVIPEQNHSSRQMKNMVARTHLSDVRSARDFNAKPIIHQTSNQGPALTKSEIKNEFNDNDVVVIPDRDRSSRNIINTAQTQVSAVRSAQRNVNAKSFTNQTSKNQVSVLTKSEIVTSVSKGKPSSGENVQDQSAVDESDTTRRPPKHVAAINNLSDRQYCCVWNIEVFPDGYRPDVARVLLAQVAWHVNPILRARGWRVKRLIESCSSSFLGCCYSNGRDDADAASTNIKLNLRVRPNKHCQQFYSFRQILSVMLHEITHTSIGLEDIHPPAFFELMDEIKKEYRERFRAGEVEFESDTYGCEETTVTKSGQVKTIREASTDILRHERFDQDGLSSSAPTADDSTSNNECGVSKLRSRRWKKRRRQWNRTTSAAGQSRQRRNRKKPPLLKGAKMIDGRTKEGKSAKTQKQRLTPRELAAQAALARLGQAVVEPKPNGFQNNNHQPNKDYSSSREDCSATSDSSGEQEDDDVSSDDEDLMTPHELNCDCRCCNWDKTLFIPKEGTSSLSGS